MKYAVIVDDDMIVRVTLRSLIDWGAFDFEIVGDFINGHQALSYLQTHPVDLLLTDMKMPVMDGTTLMQNLKQKGIMPVTVALSGYNEFALVREAFRLGALVREAFRLGAYDYILKADLNQESLTTLLKKLNETVFQGIDTNREERKEDFGITEGMYITVLFEIQSFKTAAERFGENLRETLVRPFLELARQIPSVEARAVIEEVSLSRFRMFYRVSEKEVDQSKRSLMLLVRQLQSIWMDYMNLSVSAAVSECFDSREIKKGILECEKMLPLMLVQKGRKAACWWEQVRRAEQYTEYRKKYWNMMNALYMADEVVFEEERGKFERNIMEMKWEDMKESCLLLICLLAEIFEKYQDDFTALFPDETDYEMKLERLQNKRELQIWMNNYFCWVMEHAEKQREGKEAGNIMLRARRFMSANYANPELSLKSVADYVGLNEKYFTSRFTKECGMTFTAFLTQLRLTKAEELLMKTDLKMYEVSEKVGYRSVEHFSRVFKKVNKISPLDYKKIKNLTKDQEIEP